MLSYKEKLKTKVSNYTLKSMYNIMENAIYIIYEETIATRLRIWRCLLILLPLMFEPTKNFRNWQLREFQQII